MGHMGLKQKIGLAMILSPFAALFVYIFILCVFSLGFREAVIIYSVILGIIAFFGVGLKLLIGNDW
jgi:hypothetical protein